MDDGTIEIIEPYEEESMEAKLDAKFKETERLVSQMSMFIVQG